MLKKFILIPLIVASLLFIPTFKIYQPETEQIQLSEQIDCLARNIYNEAVGESFEGKLAVAQIVINRTQTVGFPDSVCGVVYQRNIRTCQFSWVCMKPRMIADRYLWEESQYIAKRVLTNTLSHDTLANENALFYHAKYVKPGWDKTQVVARIGNHIFYKDI